MNIDMIVQAITQYGDSVPVRVELLADKNGPDNAATLGTDPKGRIEINVINPAVATFFKAGITYMVTFTPLPPLPA